MSTRDAFRKGGAIDDGAALGLTQMQVSAKRCRCGHGRPGHRSYYFDTGTTRCVEDRACQCEAFDEAPAVTEQT